MTQCEDLQPRSSNYTTASVPPSAGRADHFLESIEDTEREIYPSPKSTGNPATRILSAKDKGPSLGVSRYLNAQ